MQKAIWVTVELIVEENIDNSDIKENIKNLSYLSEEPLKLIDIEMDRWVR